MNVQITHVIVHDPKQVREIVREATAIMDEGSFTPEQWPIVFAKVCDLLGQRYTFAASPQPLQMPTMAIPGNMGRH